MTLTESQRWALKGRRYNQGEPRSEVEKHRVCVDTLGNSVSKEGRSGRNYWYQITEDFTVFCVFGCHCG